MAGARRAAQFHLLGSNLPPATACKSRHTACLGWQAVGAPTLDLPGVVGRPRCLGPAGTPRVHASNTAEPAARGTVSTVTGRRQAGLTWGRGSCTTPSDYIDELLKDVQGYWSYEEETSIAKGFGSKNNGTGYSTNTGLIIKTKSKSENTRCVYLMS